jgi:salicylate hydroxylase
MQDVRRTQDGRPGEGARSGAPVIVVGGGIGGLATALALARKGVRVRVFEQAAEIKPVGAGLQLGPNAFRIFDALGLTAGIRARATFPETLLILDAITGDEITNVPVGEGVQKRFGYPYAMMHRADLHEVLLDACRGAAGVTLHTGRKLAGFEDAGDRVVVRTADGDAHEAAALVGADGLWSTVRAAIVGDGAPRRAGHICYRAIVPTETIPPAYRRNAMALWVGPRCHLVLWPMRQDRFYNVTAVFHSERQVEGWDTHGAPEELFERFAEARPELRAVLERVDDWRMFVLSDREPIRNWSKGRVTLLGDAAHPMLQYLAQGACMAMEDAVALAGAVARRGDDYAQAFLDYQAERYLRTTRVQLTARLYGHVYHAEGATADLRNAFLKGRTAAQTMEGMAWLYETAPIAD